MTSPEAERFLSDPLVPADRLSKWADLGCGTGTFTLALASLLAPRSIIHAVDIDSSALSSIPDLHHDVTILKSAGNFLERPLPFQLDGVIMANSLHYVQDKVPFLKKLSTHLKPSGIVILVEYEMKVPDHWVPYPVTFSQLGLLFGDLGFGVARKIYERPSNYNKAMMYSVMIGRI